jgi:PIN domain nuclease of toxin-antitoxin system
MSHLLDTHTLIWFLENDSRLPSMTRTQIETTPTVFVSIVSLWEIAIKANIGKLTLSFPFNTIAPNLITAGITQLPITFKDLEIYLSLPLHHRDSFDRPIHQLFPHFHQPRCSDRCLPHSMPLEITQIQAIHQTRGKFNDKCQI